MVLSFGRILAFAGLSSSRLTTFRGSLQFFTQCGLTGLKKSSDQFALAAYDHPWKSLEPFSMGNLRLCSQPVTQQPKLINRNVAALDSVQQVRP